MVNKQLKDVLKSLNVLYISKKNNRCIKTLNTLEIFFNKTLEVHNAEEASVIYTKSRPAVIITDIDLPRQNGIEFIKEIRKTNRRIPIIILSALKDEEYLFEAIKLHLIDYLLYPIDINKFITAINTTAKAIVYNGLTEVMFKNHTKYNYVTKTITDNDNNTHNLTKNEFRLLELLIENKNRKISKEEIEEYLWAEEFITESAFKSLFNRLRHKIGKESIVNTFGVGYNINI